MDNNEAFDDFDNVLHAFIDIGNQLQSVQIQLQQEHLYDAEGLGKKILNHLITIRFLSNGYQFNGFEPLIDFGSMATLTRTCLENYLVYNYLFVAPKNEDEKTFKILAWHLGGLGRIKYPPAYEGNKNKWEHEMKLADELRNKIKNTTFFIAMHKNNQKKISNHHWMVGQWANLALAAGFSDTFFRKQYMYLSAFAHSNRHGVIQIQQEKTIPQQHEMATSLITICTAIMAKFAWDYIHVMPGLTQKISLNDTRYNVLWEYKDMAETFDKETTEKNQ